jgi:membrane protein YdbS with pleckstrin-like domain
MLYAALRDRALRVLRAPAGPPEPPAGSGESVQVFRASPRFLTYRLLGYWLGFALLWLCWWWLLVAALVEQELGALVLAVLLFPLLLALQFLAYFCLRIDYEQRYYVFTDRSLRVRQGALVVKELTVTHANIQNLRVTQGPIQKLFGISDLKVDTAGGGAASAKGQHDTGHSVAFAGIENAPELRDRLLLLMKQHGRSAGLGDPEDEQAAREPSAELLLVLRGVREAAAGLRRACEA